ncbi:Sm-like ribonucleoprotein [Suillus fuscotomentosus]|uniref:Small nuclear ribonucleoprotein E n=1 Tax=Suillus fuscotomentosus TaxID=1912939 RepID=A0AAD4HTN3_9AGAM|nr:Sm-like ribonucleoprotein [Suillus fuscotomentosus]KAG1908473.1 Sm-like ribonucleoprotein [Suillus fuscotomentosus]
MSGRQQRVLVQPINVIFKNLQQRTKVVIWLYDNIEMRIEGRIIVRALSQFQTFLGVEARLWQGHGTLCLRDARRSFLFFSLCLNYLEGFDEFMNVVVDEAAEVYVKDAKPRRELGRILLKGDNITLIQQVV